jgi:hypothetical protein
VGLAVVVGINLLEFLLGALVIPQAFPHHKVIMAAIVMLVRQIIMLEVEVAQVV